MYLLALLLLVNSPVILTKTPPPNPLGSAAEGLTIQYRNLNNPSIVAHPFDIGGPQSALVFNPENPPLFIDLARGEVGVNAWAKFLVDANGVSPCLTNPVMTKAWSGECRVVCSALRDSTAIYSAVFPGPGDRYQDDPWYTIQEDVAHKCYYLTGTLGDIMKVEDNTPEREAQFIKIKDWITETINTIGLHGEKHIFGDPNLPTWNQYVRLNGAIENDGSFAGANSPFTTRFVNAQFWGKDATAKAGYDAYENLAFLFKTQLEGAFGKDDEHWNAVMGYEDLSLNKFGWYEAQETFHELRKQIRMMWRTMSKYPQIMPLGFYPNTLDNNIPALWDTTAWLSYKQQGSDQLFIYQIFANSDQAKSILKNAGFPDAVIQLATSMALGGYYHLDFMIVDPTLDPEAHIGDNNCVWDFVERFGYINDIFMEYKYSIQAGKPANEIALFKQKMNQLWATLKGWLVANDLKNLLSDLLFPYFPVGNETSGPQKSFFPSSNLPVMVIDTRGIKIPERDSLVRELNATIKIYETSVLDEPDVRYITMKQHGQSTRLFPKHSYQVTFKHGNWTDDDKLHLLGMSKNEDWMFKGFYIDMTLIRDPVAYNLSNSMGMYAPDSRQIELYIIDDGAVEVSYFVHYQGVYCVEEKIGRGKHKVNIPKQDPESPGWTPGSGGYIFSGDKYEAGVDFVIELTHAGPISIAYPGTSHQNDEERAWATSYLQRFEEALYSEEFLQQGGPNGWGNWIDLDSWVNYFLHGEFVKSVDGFKFSTYFSITGENSVITFGPPWDYDLGLGNTGWVVDASGVMKLPNLWAYQHQIDITEPCPAFWFGRMLNVGDFKHAVTVRWKELRKTVWSDERIKIILKDQKDHIQKAANRNFQKWETLGSTSIWPYQPAPVPVSFDGYNDLLETFLLARASWMDLNVPRVIKHSYVGLGSTCMAGDPEPLCPTVWDGDSNYPNCTMLFWWLMWNWQSDPKFVEHGVDGTRCSVQRYFHWENNVCPDPPANNPDATPKCFGGCGPGSIGWGNNQYCVSNYKWLAQNWEQPDLKPGYVAAGIDGSPCSLQKYLADSNICDPILGGEHLYCANETCVWNTSFKIPTPSPTPYPSLSPSLSPTPAPTSSPIPSTPSPTPSPTTHHPTPPPINPTSLPTLSPTSSNVVVRKITFVNADYSKIIGDRHDEFIQKCNVKWNSVECMEVESGSIILTLQGQPAALDMAEKDIKASGLNVGSFDGIRFVTKPDKKPTISGAGTVALVIGCLVVFGSCVALGLCYVMQQKNTQHGYVGMNSDQTYQPPVTTGTNFAGIPEARKGSAQEHVAQL